MKIRGFLIITLLALFIAAVPVSASEGAVTFNGSTYNATITGTEAGRAYTLIVLAGEHDTFPGRTISELNPIILYMDMKKAVSDTLDFTFIPKKEGLATVFVADGVSAPFKIGLIEGPPVKEDEKVQCTVTFDAGGGKGTMDPQSVDIGSLYTLPECTFTAPDVSKVFAGWDKGDAGDVISMKEDLTLTALWEVPQSSGQDEDDDEEEEEKPEVLSGFKAEFSDPAAIYVFTGYPIRPEVKVTYNDKVLLQDVDYTLAYKDNVNASVKKKASVTITGKNNTKGKAELQFTIEPKSLKKGDTRGGTLPVETPDTIYVVKGAKDIPTIMTYGNYELKPKAVDYYLHHPLGIQLDGEQAINPGKNGNFKDSRIVNVKVLTAKELKEKSIAVTLGRESHTYNGQPKAPATLKVTSPDGTDITDKAGEAYIISYQGSNIDAGTVKFTVTGLYPYTGSIKKSFKIEPANVSPEVSVSATAVYRKDGAVPEISVKHEGKLLVKGQDYKVSFSGNKKTGTAGYKISFLNNYKKSSAKTGSFTVTPASITGARVVARDVLYGKKPGAYPSAPYVEIGGVLLGKKDYTVSYLTQDDEVIDKANPISLSEGSIKVKVSVEGKGNYAGQALGSYLIVKPDADKTDISKAKILAEDGSKIGSQEYTGYSIRPKVILKVKINGNMETVDRSKYTVSYIGNVSKGKAVIVVNAKEGSGLIGSVVGGFSIVSGTF